MPSGEKILQILAMTPEDLDKEENKVNKAAFLWYFDRFLPIAAGKHYWGEEIRYYHLPTDMGNIRGKQKVLVTVTSEAFGLLNLENCQEKWVKMYEYKREHGQDANIPVKGDAAKPFKGKWTDGKCGRVSFGGWHEDAFKAFDHFRDKIKEFRNKDEINNKQMQRYAYKLLREKKGIVQEAPKPKRQKKNRTVVTTQKKRKITRDEE